MLTCLSCGNFKVQNKELAIYGFCKYYQAVTFVRGDCPQHIDYEICPACNTRFGRKEDPLLLCVHCRIEVEHQKKMAYGIMKEA